jgi:hypothetical protein
MTIRNPAAAHGIAGSIEPLAHHEASRLRAAAHHARRVYPGPLGELVSRELTAYADFGHRLAADGLATRLARHVLTLTACPPAQAGDVPS